MSMKVIKSGVKITLYGHTYLVDVVLGMYANSLRPSVILVDSAKNTEAFGEVVAIASTNAPQEFMIGMPEDHFAAKTYSENEGLWEQLEPLLSDETNSPLFLRTSWKLTLGFIFSPVYSLGPEASNTFLQLKESMVNVPKL